ncbi:aldehyde ferredoxin oxidoreductase N-terminal domain-containing protein [Methanothermococcus okinawensis]|uniref:Aldehyde ferredoxin oxidoreductase n=1 Tax=Methanothermococcus okinawensis (strain DSM 14208 / JCM 11175 / IH1) TaxID=647113 RepID=F8AJQ3_METOI|nr:aldehyde ferredoxin oxidoreductase N-terminal domain-containing protein [Methanothermococcus okinawensis]AEH07251.1 Aldehyde ferredoxin oxidoreductase [Methanothermococcus okinawensis IH1]
MNILINASNKKYETINKEFFPINWGIYLHKKYETWKYDVYDEHNIFCFGRGVIPIIGGHRLIFSFRSPLWDGFHFSAMGGAGYVFKNTGLHNVAIIGKCEKPSLLILDGEGEDLKVEFMELNESNGFDIKNYKNIYDLNEYILKKFNEKNYRAFIVGPASLNTNMGGIFSQTVRNGKLVEGSEDWAARGGVGSVLCRAHNILGVVYYGKNGTDEEVKKQKDIEKRLRNIVEEHYKKPYMTVVLEHTKKYRYNEKTKTGGTFGNNYHYTLDITPIFNWRMPYIHKNDRIELHKKIMKYFVETFNKESIEPKKWTNCGEPCPVLCKKYRNGLKVDYEPYESNGPLLGIFDIHAADKIVHTVDALGFDAIEFGNLASYVFELLHVGLLKPEEVGIDKPIFDITHYQTDDDILKNSQYNAELAVKLANIIAFKKNELAKILSLGKRKASKILNDKFKDRLMTKNADKFNYEKFEDFGVYIPFGDNGEISPTQYWAIGNFMPYLIQGKYLTYYQCGEFLEPEELAKLSVERVIMEITIEDLGICRFHRKWIYPIIKPLLKEITDVDLDSTIKELIKDICEYDKKIGYPPYIESQRVKDLIMAGAGEFGNDKWALEFNSKGEVKLKEYIKRVMNEYSRLLNIDWKIKED